MYCTVHENSEQFCLFKDSQQLHKSKIFLNMSPPTDTLCVSIYIFYVLLLLLIDKPPLVRRWDCQLRPIVQNPGSKSSTPFLCSWSDHGQGNLQRFCVFCLNVGWTNRVMIWSTRGTMVLVYVWVMILGTDDAMSSLGENNTRYR